MTRRVCAVFDVDDTLYLEGHYVRSGFDAVGCWTAKWLGIPDFAARCWERFIAGRRGSIFDQVLRECHRNAAPELVSALVAIYRTHMPTIALSPDASEVLDAVFHAASIAIISDGPVVSQSRKVEALGLASFADPIVLTEIMGSAFRKPHARAFEHVKQCLAADVYLYIADNPLKDFTAPKQLGWVTVRVRRPNGLHCDVENPEITPDYEMRDCYGLPELLAQL